MRILIVTNYQPPHMGGIEFATESLKRCWQESGHDVTLLTTDLPPGARPSTPDNVRLWAANFLESGWQINSPLVCPTSYPEIARLVKSHDVVNIHSLAPGLSTVALYAAVRRRKPTVATQHVGVIPLANPLLDRFQEKFLCAVARWCVRRRVPLTFVGQAVRAWFVERARIPLESTVMTPAGIDQRDYFFVPEADRRVFRQKWNLPAEKLNVLFVGRFYEKKGLLLLKQVAERCPDVQFTLVGGGPIQVAEWALPNVRKIKFVPTPDLRELYGSHDLFIMPSVGEGWPAVVPQAMACGCACLISEETFSGYGRDPERFLVRPRNVDILAETLRGAAAGKIPLLGQRESLSEYACRTWNWKTTAEIYIELFRKLTDMRLGS